MVEASDFKEAMAHWASGVTIVTSILEGRKVGITASSFTSLSLTPPSVLICVNKRLYTHQVIQESGVFAVNILNSGQKEWGMRFAGMLPEQDDRFHDIETLSAETGCPLLPDVLSWFDCRVLVEYDGGDHTIFVGEVVACRSQGGAEPILYFNRSWHTLATDKPVV